MLQLFQLCRTQPQYNLPERDGHTHPTLRSARTGEGDLPPEQVVLEHGHDVLPGDPVLGAADGLVGLRNW